VSPFITKPADGGVLRVGNLPLRPIPVIPVHLSMAAARRMAALKQIALLLVEREEQIVGMIDERALGADHDTTPVAAAMRPLARCLRPRTLVAEARELFIRARVAILPVAAGGFILGAVTRGVVERARA
jgi:CBS domain-containing protein